MENECTECKTKYSKLSSFVVWVKGFLWSLPLNVKVSGSITNGVNIQPRCNLSL